MSPAKDWVRESLAGCRPSRPAFRCARRARSRPGRAQPHRHRDRSGARLRHRPSRHHARLSVGARPVLKSRAGPPRISISAPARAYSPSRRARRCAVACSRPISTPVRARGAGKCPAEWRGSPDQGLARGRPRGAGDWRARAVRSRVGQYSLRPPAAAGRPADQTVAPGGHVVLSGLLTRRPMRRCRLSRAAARTADRDRRLDDAGAEAAAPRSRHRCSHRQSAPRFAAMFEAHFQSFEDRGERGASAARLAACAPSSSGAVSTALSCRAPTATRTNMCRPAPSGWLF